jgi:hypothetical protein
MFTFKGIVSGLFLGVLGGLGVHIADNLWLVGSKMVELGSNSAHPLPQLPEQKPGTGGAPN